MVLIDTSPRLMSTRMFRPPLLLLLPLCRRRCCCCRCRCRCCCCCRYSLLRAFQKTQNEKQSVVPSCAPRCIADREAAAAAAAAQQQQQRQQQQQQQQQRRRRRRAPLWSLGLAVVLCLRCRACALCVRILVVPRCPGCALRASG